MITAKVWYIKALAGGIHRAPGALPSLQEVPDPWLRGCSIPGDLGISARGELMVLRKGKRKGRRIEVGLVKAQFKFQAQVIAQPHKLRMRRERHLPAERYFRVTVVQNEQLVCQEHPSPSTVHRINSHLRQA